MQLFGDSARIAGRGFSYWLDLVTHSYFGRRQCLCEKVLGRVLMLMPGLTFGRRELEKDFTTKDLLSFGWMIG